MPKREPEQLQGRRFDLLIIGGGITGATLAWDASLRGLKVALVDQGDFGCATSSATSKLIHGGLRYLKNGRLGLVRESLRERRIFQSIAGHLVRPLPFLLPTYRRGNKKSVIRLGLGLYDLLGWDRGRIEDGDQRLPAHQTLGRKEVLELEPSVTAEALTGGALYYDCQCEPDRLTLEFILGAVANGAVAINYVRVRDVICRVGRVDAVEVEDRLSGRRFEVAARLVANVTGPWADQLDRLCGVEGKMRLRRSKGIHLVTRPLTVGHALVLRTTSGRHLFVIPWRGHSLIGTTDTLYQGKPEELTVEDAEVAALVEEVNQILPAAKLNVAAVKYRYAGLRPLVDDDSQVYSASRRYEILDHHRGGIKGLITAAGGKYTTSRSLARKLTDRILAHLGEPRIPCRTEGTRLPGSVGGSLRDYLGISQERAGDLLSAKTLEHLVQTYGSRHEEILELVRRRGELGEPLLAGRPEIAAQLVYAVEEEVACTMCDVLFRRTSLGCFGDPGDEFFQRAGGLLAPRLGWDGDRLAREIAACREKMRGLPERLTL